MTTIYAATGNLGKLEEFTASAQGAEVEVLPLPGLKTMPEPVEDATTYLGNAELKAIAYSLLSPGLLVLADDSGLEVAALNGAPGVRSARFAEDAAFTEGTTKDERNNRLLLKHLADHSDRRAQFVCALAVARDGAVLWRASGSCPGEILDSPRGQDGFGYDPLFLVPEFGRSMAELSRSEKWSVSHRGRAFREMLNKLTA